jgi:hypothetical protein
MKELDFLLVALSAGRHAEAASEETCRVRGVSRIADPDMVRYLIAGDVPKDSRFAGLCRSVLQAN